MSDFEMEWRSCAAKEKCAGFPDPVKFRVLVTSPVVYCSDPCTPANVKEARLNAGRAKAKKKRETPMKQYEGGLVDSVGLAKILDRSYASIGNYLKDGKIKVARKEGARNLFDPEECKRRLNYRDVKAAPAEEPAAAVPETSDAGDETPPAPKQKRTYKKRAKTEEIEEAGPTLADLQAVALKEANRVYRKIIRDAAAAAGENGNTEIQLELLNHYVQDRPRLELAGPGSCA